MKKQLIVENSRAYKKLRETEGKWENYPIYLEEFKKKKCIYT
jgi:hypothetical protein